jgi:hypothetical protein
MTLIRTVLAGLVVFIAACQVVPVEGERPAGATEAAHNCIDACDHIYADGGWLIIRGHRHGPNCGHVKVDGKWVKDTAPPEPLKTPKDQN